MKMNQTATAVAIQTYPSYVYNCTRNPACERQFAAPLPSVAALQLYVDFGLYKPVVLEFQLQDTCVAGPPEQLFPDNYVVGLTPEGRWYGVFKYFNAPATAVTSFIMWLSALVVTPAGLQERTFFSEQLMVEPCDPLMKVKACQPELSTTTGFDVNGLYYGLPFTPDFQGMAQVRYYHISWVRLGKVRELTNKATFTQSLLRNFRTTIERTWLLETELVPRWYKDVLLAIYARGAVQINDGTTYLVSDLAFEALNDNDITWKPFAQLKQTTRLYFGCDESLCSECCSPAVISATATSEEDSASAGESVSASVPPEPPTSIEGSIIMDSDCPGGAQQINNVTFALPPGDSPVQAGVPGDYPILPGETVPSSFVGVSGTGDITIYYRETAFQMYVRVVDSLGNVFCGPTAFGVDEDNSMSFTGITLSTSPTNPWSVTLSCTPCE